MTDLALTILLQFLHADARWERKSERPTPSKQTSRGAAMEGHGQGGSD